jgi:hypothetical protein
MKMTGIFLAIVWMAGCSKPSSTETATADTVQTDSSAYELAEYEMETEMEEVSEGNEVDLELYYDERSHIILNEGEFFYQVNIVFNGYESMSDVTWFFDKEFSVRCYKQNWSMEGQEGSEEFFLRNDSIICMMEIETGGVGTITTRVCTEVGGMKTTENYDQDPVNEPVPANYLDDKRKEFDRYLQTLKDLLGGVEVTEPDAETYTLKIENVVDVGQEVTETTTITIPKALYEKLTN